jgi:hypothetical protein
MTSIFLFLPLARRLKLFEIVFDSGGFYLAALSPLGGGIPFLPLARR